MFEKRLRGKGFELFFSYLDTYRNNEILKNTFKPLIYKGLSRFL